MDKPIFTQEQAVDQLLDRKKNISGVQAAKWGVNSYGTSATVAYSYLGESEIKDVYKDRKESPLTDEEIELFESYIQLIEDVAHIDLFRVGILSDNGAIKIQKNDGDSGKAKPTVNSLDGLDKITEAIVTVKGNFNQRHSIHEMLHALGLSHPGPYDLSDNEYPTYADDATHFQDSTQYTIMSYFGGKKTGASYGRPGTATLMVHDVLALQRLYGPNYSAFNGNTVYGFNSNTNRDPWTVTDTGDNIFGAIWDSGGNDTIDASGYFADAFINLGEYTFSSLNGHTSNVSIVPGTVIENAISGSGNDTLYGNDVANILRGGDGRDSLVGNDGNDKLYGEDGNDILNGDSLFETGDDNLYGGRGHDTLFGGRGHDTLFGGLGNDKLNGGSGKDYLDGENGNDTLWGDSGHDKLYGRDGDDFIEGGSGNDTLLGHENNDTLYGQEGDDDLGGGSGNDILRGHQGNDTLRGYTGNDELHGGSGGDNLIGGSGRDTLTGGNSWDNLTGGSGYDTFKYVSTSDAPTDYWLFPEIINDFQRGVDKIDFSTIDADTLISSDQAFDFIGTSSFTKGGVGQVRYSIADDSVVVQADIRGDGNLTPDLEIMLLGDASSVSASDFIL